MWLNKFKIAVIEKNTDAIETLLEELPTFNSAEEMNEAKYLLKEAANLLVTFREETGESMRQIKKNLSFLKVTQDKKESCLDIKM